MELLARDQRDTNREVSSIRISPTTDADVVAALIRPGFVRWSPREAAMVLSVTAYPKQTRHLTKQGQLHSSVLAEIMRRDLWRPFDKIDFARLPSRELILVNGHHRLTAQSKAGIPVEWTVVVHDRASMEEVAELYHDFDTNVRLRTNPQILGATGAAESWGLSKPVAEAVFKAVPLIAAGLDTNRKNRDLLSERIYGVRIDLVEDYKVAAQTFEKCLDQAESVLKRRILSIGSTAVALVTLKFQPRKAESFWSLVCEEDGLSRGHPCHTYIKTVRTRDAGSTSYLSAAWAAAAWNAYCRDERPGHFSPGDPKPIKVIGTPFDKGR
jgi:hypothetical protein